MAITLEQILQVVDSVDCHYVDCSRSIEHITFDSRDVTSKSCFVALEGTATDGHLFIEDVIAKGCTVIVCEKLPETIHQQVSYFVVKNSHVALSQMAALFYDYPSQKLTLVGITGTNGKTTTATLLYRMVKKMGYKVGLLSTITVFIDNEEYLATHTTPDALTIQKYLQQMVDSGCQYCFMEVSSHALAQHRTDNLKFKIAVFSNITLDHLDYHKTFLAYIQAKKLLFDGLSKESTAIINVDDKNGNTMVQNCKANIIRTAMHTAADIEGKLLEQDSQGMLLKIGRTEFWSPLIGEFNGHNLLAIYSVAHALEFQDDDIFPVLSQLRPVAGRFEYVRSKHDITAIIDYAHTPDALLNVLETIHNIRRSTEKIITVVGCGGNRDKSKRPIMAKIACDYSDKVILTSDNPRHEEPKTILEDMAKGIPKNKNIDDVLIVVDRREAIIKAKSLAKSGDIILLAGKGHETYQIIGDTQYHFDDKEEFENNDELRIINKIHSAKSR